MSLLLGGGRLMHGIKIPQQDFALKMGGLIREGKAYLRDTTVLVLHRRLLLRACFV